MDRKSGLVVRPWVEADLEGVFQLIDRENWGWELHEIKRIHMLDPQSSVVAEESGELTGLVTVINFGLMAFVVHVIVKEGSRRKGLGKTMVKAAVGRLDAKGVGRVELHANPEALDFYRQMGFQGADEIAFYSRDATTKDAGLRTSMVASDNIAMLGKEKFGSVSKLISKSMQVSVHDVSRALAADTPDVVSGLVERGRVRGALLGKTNVELSGIGPWVMEEFDEDLARKMLQQVLRTLPGKRTDVCIPFTNRESRDLIESEGFYLVKRGLVRTVRSESPVERYPPGLLAVGHFAVI
jgi:ribosomal protein S18 acetylase RimI-like enzyme